MPQHIVGAAETDQAQGLEHLGVGVALQPQTMSAQRIAAREACCRICVKKERKSRLEESRRVSRCVYLRVGRGEELVACEDAVRACKHLGCQLEMPAPRNETALCCSRALLFAHWSRCECQPLQSACAARERDCTGHEAHALLGKRHLHAASRETHVGLPATAQMSASDNPQRMRETR